MSGLPNTLSAADFAQFFCALHGEGRPPFPWQMMLMERVAAEGWPDLIDLPTASGKTACMDVAIFALAMGLKTPRRIWFVVDRRIVVDEAFERAEEIAKKLQKAEVGILKNVRDNLLAVAGCVHGTKTASALGVARLRGGAPKGVSWSRNPAQPAVITSTIDQLGSRLLFRGYGVGDRMLPIHAALAGNDSLVIVDEAHLAGPFVETVGWVEKLRDAPWAKEPVEKPFKLVVMSATPPEGEDSRKVFPQLAERQRALQSEPLQKRIRSAKVAELRIASGKTAKGEVVLSSDELVVDATKAAAAWARSGNQRIAVMVNRVATATKIVEALGKVLADGEADVQLVTGRRRPVDRDYFVKTYKEKLKSGSKLTLENPIIVVTTQCLEVGADFSFDALVTECASLDALRQRFGRLDRLGDLAGGAKAVILARKSDVPADGDLKEDKPRDRVYGNALARTWNWLRSLDEKWVDMGIGSLAPHVAEAERTGKMQSLLGPRRHAPLMLPAYLDLWSQTNPKPALAPEVALFLHGVPPAGERVRPDVRVIWRQEVEEAEGQARNLKAERKALEAMPPVSAEMLTLPLRELREFLSGGKLEAGDDLEGGVETEKDNVSECKGDRVWVWRHGALQQELCDTREIRPQDVVVLSASGKSFEKLCPLTVTPADVYEWAYWQAKQALAVRVPGLFGQAAVVTTEEGENAAVEDLWEAIRTSLVRMPGDSDNAAPAEQWIADIGRLATSNSKGWRGARVVTYGDGKYLLTRNRCKDVVEDWAFEPDDEDESISLGKERLGLERHTQQVREATIWLANTLMPHHAGPFEHAAAMHDFGKADPRFQEYLAGRRWAGELLAKSGRSWARWDEQRLQASAGVPTGFRHEALSVQLAALSKELTQSPARELVLHLIGTHHGRARPLPEVVEDADPPPVSAFGLSLSSAQRRDNPAHRLDSGALERFWALTRQFGWWGLAYLESLLRCADQYASAIDAQEDEG